MKTLIVFMLSAFCFTLTATATPNTHDHHVVKYLESQYGTALWTKQVQENLIIEFNDYQVIVNDNKIVSLYNYNTQTWETVPIEKANIDILLMHYSVLENKVDNDGHYISISRFDGSLEYKFYYEEYYWDGSKFTYYNSNNEEIIVAGTKAYYGEIVFNLLN